MYTRTIRLKRHFMKSLTYFHPSIPPPPPPSPPHPHPVQHIHIHSHIYTPSLTNWFICIYKRQKKKKRKSHTHIIQSKWPKEILNRWQAREKITDKLFSNSFFFSCEKTRSPELPVLLNVLGCRLTYKGQDETNAWAWFNIALRPRKP